LSNLRVLRKLIQPEIRFFSSHNKISNKYTECPSRCNSVKKKETERYVFWILNNSAIAVHFQQSHKDILIYSQILSFREISILGADSTFSFLFFLLNNFIYQSLPKLAA
jgi:hypothetical protein